jgi:glycosyltransferase involved in cell wall biosynthesis
MDPALADPMPSTPQPVALVHDWLTGMRGGERVLEALAEAFPGAHLFTLFHLPGSVSPDLEALPVHTSFLQRFPFLARGYRYYLPLFPRAAESLDLSGYRLVISSSHCVAKGVQVDRDAFHLCYCHTPMRYAWDGFDDYFGPEAGSRIPAFLARRVIRRLQRWDAGSNGQVDAFLANSRHVARRIDRCYRRRAQVLPPPVDIDTFRPGDGERSDAYLLVAALVPYKKIERAMRAVAAVGGKLRVVGSGPQAARLRRLAGEETTFLGRLPEADLVREYQRCRALLMPGVEDAGIAPLEAMACGRPVIALDAGGAPEVVVEPGGAEPPTGLLFPEPTVESLAAALRTFPDREQAFDPAALHQHAQAYARPAFLQRIRSLVADGLQARAAAP